MKKELKIDTSIGIKRLKLVTSKLVNTKILGGYRSVFKGRGLEFHDYRKYTPDDDAEMIDWKSSIRSKELLVKEFVEERNLNVFFLIDISSSMIYSSTDKLKIEYAAELAATLSYAVLHVGDSIGFAFFNDKIVKYDPPRSGPKQHYNLIKNLVDPRYYGGNYDLTSALKFIMAFLKEFSVVILITDFIGLKNDWKQYLKLVGKKFDLIGVMIHDPIDEALPNYDGQVILGDFFSNKQLIVDVDKLRNQYAKYVQAMEREISNAFIESSSDFVHLRTDKPFLQAITNLFLSRVKKIR